MRSTIRNGLVAAAITAAGLTALTPSAAAQPSM